MASVHVNLDRVRVFLSWSGQLSHAMVASSRVVYESDLISGTGVS